MINLALIGDKVEDVEEELFILYSLRAGYKPSSDQDLLQSIVTSDTSNASALGLVDQKNDQVTLRFEFTTPVPNTTDDNSPSPSSSNIKHKKKGSKHSTKLQKPQTKETSVEVTLAQDITALRSRAGDTGGGVWRGSILFAWKVLQQIHGNGPEILFDQVALKSANILELGAGTGLLGLLLAPYVQGYTCTDLPELVPLIKKNFSINNSFLPSSKERLVAEPLNWVDVYECPPTSRYRLFSRNIYGMPEDLDLNGNPDSGVDLILAVDCVYNPALILPLLTTIDLFAVPGRTTVLVVMELRDEDVVREFLLKWTEMLDWEIWRIGNESHPSPLDTRFAIWLGKKTRHYE